MHEPLFFERIEAIWYTSCIPKPTISYLQVFRVSLFRPSHWVAWYKFFVIRFLDNFFKSKRYASSAWRTILKTSRIIDVQKKQSVRRIELCDIPCVINFALISSNPKIHIVFCQSVIFQWFCLFYHKILKVRVFWGVCDDLLCWNLISNQASLDVQSFYFPLLSGCSSISSLTASTPLKFWLNSELIPLLVSQIYCWLCRLKLLVDNFLLSNYFCHFPNTRKGALANALIKMWDKSSARTGRRTLQIYSMCSHDQLMLCLVKFSSYSSPFWSCSLH